MAGRPLIASGIGEKLSPLTGMPRFTMVLGNPLRGVSTPEVFSRLASRQNTGLVLNDPRNWMSILNASRNDLERAASDLVPEIGELCELLRSRGAVLTRMSGSGATCFGIFDSRRSADHAASMLQAERPDWYFASTETIAGS
jgi:4-diphosphocytidyl-2-C-methyl-D-erythritol kinase